MARDSFSSRACPCEIGGLRSPLRREYVLWIEKHGTLCLRLCLQLTLVLPSNRYMGLGAYFGYFVSQNGRGHVLGHVKDLGEDATAKDRVRIYRTNAK